MYIGDGKVTSAEREREKRTKIKPRNSVLFVILHVMVQQVDTFDLTAQQHRYIPGHRAGRATLKGLCNEYDLQRGGLTIRADPLSATILAINRTTYLMSTER